MIDPNYAHPEALVTTEWVATHLNEPNSRLVESDEDILLYDRPHPRRRPDRLAGDLQDQTSATTSRQKFAELCSRNGIAADTTVVFYGDKSNWWACYAFWAFSCSATRTARS